MDKKNRIIREDYNESHSAFGIRYQDLFNKIELPQTAEKELYECKDTIGYLDNEEIKERNTKADSKVKTFKTKTF